MKTIIISVGDVSMKAAVYDTHAGKAILAARPFESTANVWGDKIYFDIPVMLDPNPEAIIWLPGGQIHQPSDPDTYGMIYRSAGSMLRKLSSPFRHPGV